MSNNPLQQLLNPRSIATVGAGNNPMKMGAIQALSIVSDGFAGGFYPIHPTEKEVFGYRAYSSPLELPEAPDLVMFVLPAPLVSPILDDFGKIGTKRAIIITAGFRETGEEGRLLEEQLKETAKRYGIRFLGPNCMGIINSEIALNVTVMPLDTAPGSLGMASQSGTYITQTLPYLQRRGIRFSKAISVGNEADLNLVDALEYLGEDEQTKAIALYIEGLKDAGRFLDTARRITPHKPVIAQYVGGSDAGARAGSSHTGALAGPDFLYDGLFSQAGVIRVHSIEDLYNHSWSLATQPPLKGRRIAVLTNSGGPGTAMSHTLNEGGLEVPRFSDRLQAAIKEVIPPHGSAGNPVDLTFHMDAEILSTTVPEKVLNSGEVDGIVMHGLMSAGFLRAVFPHVKTLLGFDDEDLFISQFSRDLTGPVALPRKYGVPMILSSFFGREDNYTRAFQDNDTPVFDAPEKAARAMLALYRYSLVQQRAEHRPVRLPERSVDAAAIIAETALKGQTTLDEFSSKKILSAYGAPVGSETLARSAEEAVEAAEKLGYPVVIKGCSAEFAHKTGRGLIHLNLKSAEEVRRSWARVVEAAGQEIPVLVAKMISGERELMAGVTAHPAFGPCVMFGMGGIFAEALQDRVFRLAPLTGADCEEMFSQIKARELLGPYRGMPPADKAALSEILQAAGNIALLHPEIAEIDLNPIIISNSAPTIADALIILKP